MNEVDYERNYGYNLDLIEERLIEKVKRMNLSANTLMDMLCIEKMVDSYKYLLQYPNATESEIRKDLKLDELPAFPKEINVDEKELPLLEKAKYVSYKVKKFNTYPKVLAHSLTKDKLEKAYELLIDFPDISKEDYLDIMGLEE